MSHSPEPWTFRPVAERDPHSRFDPLIGRAGGWVARLFCEGSSVRGLTSLAPPLEVAEANAERIVACVNACAGIPSSVLTEKEPGADFRILLSTLLQHCLTENAVGMMNSAAILGRFVHRHWGGDA